MSASAEERRSFIADPAVLADLEMTLADLEDPDARALAIRGEHPELADALDAGGPDPEIGGEPFNPRLHLAMHEVVAAQLWDDEPPEVWETAQRLREAGYDRHEIFHMLASTVSAQIWSAAHEKKPYDGDVHRTALEALPGSWEKQRTVRTATRRHDDARKEARRAARAARRRNRRPG